MAVPQTKKSRSRRDMRRAHHDKITLPQVAICDNCGADNLPHRVCGSCGFYRGRVAVPVAAELPELTDESGSLE